MGQDSGTCKPHEGACSGGTTLSRSKGVMSRKVDVVGGHLLGREGGRELGLGRTRGGGGGPPVVLSLAVAAGLLPLRES